ncbi:MAG: hypothetical protein U1F24_13970 [Alphaproteobacteria bacterium]|jgi:DNA-binding response OmpR family regulator
MTALRFDLASVAVYDPVAMNRNATRNVLYSLGFRDIDSYATLEDLRRAMATSDFDLLVLEAGTAKDPAFDTMGRIRRSEIGRNPFAIILATTWNAEGDLVRRALESGADDLVCRPYSTGSLMERLRSHIHARKGFVVTSDYVGPDRRKEDSRRTHSAKTIHVVNSLRLKAFEGLTGLEAQAAVQAGIAENRGQVNMERLRRAALQIGVIAGFVAGQAAAENGPGARRADLDKILSTAQELSTLAAAEKAQQAQNTAQTIIGVAKTAIQGVDIAKNAELIARLSVALQVTLSPDRQEDECRAELDQTLERIRARGRRA